MEWQRLPRNPSFRCTIYERLGIADQPHSWSRFWCGALTQPCIQLFEHISKRGLWISLKLNRPEKEVNYFNYFEYYGDEPGLIS